MPSNHLIHESSPYLLQHAHNPVDWYPWGKAAFEKAKREDKPILLSIGYSTCHWCHVMEQESFSDPEVGKVLNANVVAIKVDREERPDIDHVYMQAAQMLNGGGGWPLNILMTPDGRPFFAATYLPKHSRFGRIGLIELVEQVGRLWRTDRQKLLGTAGQLAAAMQSLSQAEATPGTPGKSLVSRGVAGLKQDFDAVHGGFGNAPKFPTAQRLLFLLRDWRTTHDAEALHMVEVTLSAMRRGGIFDQLGYGFHRYSTDAEWRLPHFEKMLYDQAMLLMAYAEGYQATGNAEFATTARQVADYVLGEMQAPGGGFYSAEDADSDGGEGHFYIWRFDALHKLLGKDDAAFAARVYGILPDGNVHDEGGGLPEGANVLYLAHPPADAAGKARLEAIRKKMLAARDKREHPFRDDKVLTDWNGLMIAALSVAGWALDEPAYTHAAARAADFVLGHLVDGKDRLLHRWLAGSAGIEGNLDDYAFLVWGLTELYESDFDARYLQAALQLNRTMLRDFSAADGGLYFTAKDAESLLVRPMAAFDSATPSGNAVAMMNLLHLSRISGDAALAARAARIPAAFANLLNQAPSAFPWMLAAMQQAEEGGTDVVLAGDRDVPGLKAMLRTVRRGYRPDILVLLASKKLAAIAPYTADYQAQDGKPTAYVCQGGHCNLPITDVAALRKDLDAPNGGG